MALGIFGFRRDILENLSAGSDRAHKSDLDNCFIKGCSTILNLSLKAQRGPSVRTHGLGSIGAKIEHFGVDYPLRGTNQKLIGIV